MVFAIEPAALPLAHRLWRRLPMRGRRAALSTAGRLLASRPDAVAPPLADLMAPGIAVAGEFSRPCGLTEAARLTVAGLRHLGWEPRAVDVSWRGAGLGGVALAGATPLVVHINAPDMPAALLRLGRQATRGRKVIGAWAWELPVAPSAWFAGAAYAHEIWAPSRFTAAALESILPGRVRVVTPPVAIAPPVPAALDRAAFALPSDAVVVLTSFDLASSFARKNPLAAIAAFRGAFADDPRYVLLLKIGNPGHFPADFAAIRAAVAGAKNIHLETRSLPRADNHALMACADIVLSLHRAEGFGLVLAEAMLLGKPVIATGWSGNLDFMDAATAVLVRPRMVPAADPRGVYDIAHTQWAQPSLGEAMAALRWLAGDNVARMALGARGKVLATRRLGTESLAAALAGL